MIRENETEMAARSSEDDTVHQLLDLIEGLPAATKQQLLSILEPRLSHNNTGVRTVADRKIDSFFPPSEDATPTTSSLVRPPSNNADTDEDEHSDSDDIDITDAEDVGGGANAVGEKRKRAKKQYAETHVRVCIIYDKKNGVAHRELVERYNITVQFIHKIIQAEKATHERFKEEIKVMRLHQDNTPKRDIMNMDWKHVGMKPKGGNSKRLCHSSLNKIVNEKYMHELTRTYIRCGQPPS
jgi:hypothetical protein